MTYGKMLLMLRELEKELSAVARTPYLDALGVEHIESACAIVDELLQELTVPKSETWRKFETKLQNYGATMNKTERDRLLGYISKGRFFGRETTEQLDRLRDYVDALEAALERAKSALGNLGRWNTIASEAMAEITRLENGE